MADTVKFSGLPVDTNPPASADIFATVNLGVSKQISALAAGIAGLTNKGILIANASGNIAQNINFNYDSGTGTLTSNGKTVLFGNNFSNEGILKFLGAFEADLTFTGATAVTFPTSGTLLSTTSSYVSSVSGTSNRITASPTTGAVIVDIAATYVGQSSITTLGTIATGTWNGTVITGQFGGTGVANTGKTITLGGNLTTSGAFASTFTMTNITTVTFPTSGTLFSTASTIGVANGGTGNTTFTAYSLICAGTTSTGIFQNVVGVGTSGQVLVSAGASALPVWTTLSTIGVTSVTGTASRITASPTTGAVVVDISASYVGQSSITTLGTIGTGVWQGTVITGQFGGTGVANTGKTITLGGNLTTSGAFASTFTMTNTTSVTFPTSGTLLSTANASGNYVSSLAGTSNQINVSASTGSITLSTPQDIGTASAVQFGKMGINAASLTGAALRVSPSSQDAGIYVDGTQAQNGNLGYTAGISSISVLRPPSDSPLYGIFINNAPDTTTAAVTVFYGLKISPAANPGTGSHALSVSYSFYTSPIAASSATNIYNANFDAGTVTGLVYNIWSSGQLATTNGTAVKFSNSFTSPGVSSNIYQFDISPSWIGTAGNTIGTVFGLRIKNDFTAYAGGVVSFAMGIYVDGTSTLASSTINFNYSGYFQSPSAGTNRCALFADNLNVGAIASGAQTSGTIRTAPPSSSTVTAAFASSVTLGTAIQNTTGYDILVCFVFNVTVAAGGLKMGVGSTSTPTTNAIAGSTTTNNLTVTAYIPHNYYILFNLSGGSLTFTTNIVAMAI